MKLFDELKGGLAGLSSLVVVGIGSVLRSDDACGVVFLEIMAKNLAETSNPRANSVTFINGSTAVESVTGAIIKAAPSHLIFVDAADLGASVGCIQLIPEEKIAGFSFSTHMLPLGIVIAYLQKSLPDTKVLVLGIQPQTLDFSADVRLSPEVDATLQGLARDLGAILASP